jgi:hypothetical protein
MLALRGRCSRGCAAYGRRLFPFTACAPFLPCERSEAAACRCSKDFPFPLNGHIASCNGGGDCLLIGGNFVLTGKPADILLAELPPIVHIQKESEQAAIRWSLERLREELSDPQPGGFLVAQQLAYLLLVQALRLHLAEGLRGCAGWFFAQSDKQMSAAITSMHDEPAHDWAAEELEQRTGMSRSIFALRFKETVGVSRWST